VVQDNVSNTIYLPWQCYHNSDAVSVGRSDNCFLPSNLSLIVVWKYKH